MDLKQMMKDKFINVYFEMIDERRKAPSKKQSRWDQSRFGTTKELEWSVANKYYSILSDIKKDGEEMGADFGELGKKVDAYKQKSEPSNFGPSE